MSAPFVYDVCLGHNSKDKPRVRKVAERLRAAGLRVWFDDWVIRAGDSIYLAIEHSLEASRTLALCMSPAAFDSDWVGLERETVLCRDPTNRERRFIPVLLAACDIPATLRRYKYVDYRDEGDAALRELMEVCWNKQSKQITFDGEKLDAPATWRLRDGYIKRAYADAVK